MAFRFIFIAIGLLISTFFAPAMAFSASENANTSKSIKKISAAELKSWIDSTKQFQIVDARPKKFEGGAVIPTAKFLPANSSEELIAHILPSKDAIIVVYCASIKCPASEYLSDRLVKMGYTNIYRYPEGLADWMEKGYRTETASKS